MMPMKKKEKLALLLAFLIFLIPFLGIPNNYQDILISVFGILIFVMIICGEYFENCGDKSIGRDSDIESIQQKVPEFDESEPEIDIEKEKALQEEDLQEEEAIDEEIENTDTDNDRL
jgi:hypothetical protein